MAYNIATPGGEAWDDLRIPVTATNTGPTKAPTFAQFRDDGASSTGVFTYQFSFTQENELFFQVQIPHGYKLQTDLHPHLHWSPTVSGTSGTVHWGLEYTYATISGTWPNTTTIEVDADVDGDAKHQYTEFPVISGTAFTGLSAMLSCRVYRDPTNPNDDYNQLVSLHEIDFHFIRDTLGSAQELVK